MTFEIHNYPTLAADAVELRENAVSAGQIMAGLIRSTESRKWKLTSLLSPIFALLSVW
jgi:hypothetical protein